MASDVSVNKVSGHLFFELCLHFVFGNFTLKIADFCCSVDEKVFFKKISNYCSSVPTQRCALLSGSYMLSVISCVLRFELHQPSNIFETPLLI